MTEEVVFPQTLAMFDCGESRGEIHFAVNKDANGNLLADGEDDLYQYLALPSDVVCSGTIFVRNNKTGAIKAIPVDKFIQISRQCKIQNYRKIETADTADLVNRFGTRQAKRIYNMRLGPVSSK
ncbi:hypothetical protein GPJ56_005727 [Histomonas meleagridis]|uniref:uncharacterized protein n=1 Tax=Histomonas meleagridis TaxID=135588 RepID=UPI003559A6FF|nr:hypothetical protein GPJ56_005727 [Histomonas meleagridis]KAH0803337.1 hypothetical protein GO595_003681 [Histomonas meleagridis]